MKRWITASFFMAIAVLVGGELVMRIFFARSLSGRFEYGYNPTAGFVEHGDGTISLVRAGGRHFRPQTFTRKRPPGTLRIMVIGDSVPRGASLNESYPWLIGDKLRAAGIPAESFNLALGGYGAARCEIVLRRALEYEPSHIILHVNNSNEFEDEREFRRAQEFRSWHPQNWLAKSLLLRRLYELKTEQLLWKWIPAEVRNLRAVSDADDERMASADPAKRKEWDDRVRKYTGESVELCRARGVPILLLTQVRREHDAEGRAMLDDHGLNELIQPLLGPGVYRLSMKEILASQPLDQLFIDTSHVRKPGHELIATAVVEKLKSEGIVSPPR